MNINETQICESTEKLVRQYEQWTESETNSTSICFLSFEINGREFKVQRDPTMESIFSEYRAPLLTDCQYNFKEEGTQYLHSEFSLSNCGVDEFSQFVQVLKDKGLFSHVGITGRKIDSNKDGIKPRSWIACNDKTIKDPCIDGICYDDCLVKKGDWLVEKMRSVIIKSFSHNINLYATKVSDLQYLTMEDVRNLKKIEYLLNEEFPVWSPDIVTRINTAPPYTTALKLKGKSVPPLKKVTSATFSSIINHLDGPTKITKTL